MIPVQSGPSPRSGKKLVARVVWRGIGGIQSGESIICAFGVGSRASCREWVIHEVYLCRAGDRTGVSLFWAVVLVLVW